MPINMISSQCGADSCWLLKGLWTLASFQGTHMWIHASLEDTDPALTTHVPIMSSTHLCKHHPQTQLPSALFTLLPHNFMHWQKHGNEHIVSASYCIPTWPCEPVEPLHPKRQQHCCRNTEIRLKTTTASTRQPFLANYLFVKLVSVTHGS